MDVDQSTDNNNNNSNNKKSQEPEYELSVQLAMHNSPARCVVAIDDDTIVSGGRKDGEFILWKRMKPQNQSQTTNTDDKDKDNDNDNDNDKDKSKDDDNDEKMKDINVSPIKFDGSFIFTEDNFHPLLFCAVKHKIKSEPARIVSAGNDQRAIIWDIDGNIIQQLGAHSNSVNSVDVTDNGQVITGSFDSYVLSHSYPILALIFIIYDTAQQRYGVKMDNV